MTRGLMFLVATGVLAAQTPEECRALVRHGRGAEATACFTKLARAASPYAQAEGLWGLHRYSDANAMFRTAVKADERNARYRVRWGRLLLERYNPDEAGTLFSEALKIDPNNAEAWLGAALVASESFDPKAVQFAHQALEHDPKLVEAQERLAYLALEDNDIPRAIAEADRAVAMSPEALDAMAVRAAAELLSDRSPQTWYDRILKINPGYGEAYAAAGHFFVLNRRYQEGIAYYRKALDLHPDLWEARAQLGVNLMRLGQEQEARAQLEKCYANGYRNSETVNSLTLLDSYKNFVTFRTENTILRLHKKEAELLHPYFEEELKRAIATYDQKYQMKLAGPVQLEVYPDHEDFAVRTMGLPGLGALGVTFGSVVAMDSPSGRKPGSFHWASTLWHELSHVYVLQATNHRVPRWFTEGMAVHEETAASPDWGDRLDPEVINAIKSKKLLPISKLDRGFVRPEYPSQVIVSYYQAGQICDYVKEKRGYSKLLAMMHAFGSGKSTPEVVEQELGVKPEEFDTQFLAWLDGRTKATVEHFAEWKKRVRGVAENLQSKKYDDVIKEGLAIRDLYPEYVEAASVYEMLSDAYLAKGDKAAARAQLAQYSSIGGRNPAALKKLSALEAEAGRSKEAAATLQRLNLIYPLDEDLHRRLGALALDQREFGIAIREYRAVLASKPVDPASAHFDLAKALQAAKRQDDAREEVLLALEAAPGYKPAQQLLLELSK